LSEIRFTPISFVVPGLLDRAGDATPYELKQMAARGVANCWTFHHAQHYTEPERLARAGYLEEDREAGGRRRRRYRLTPYGRLALQTWLEAPVREFYELRDAGLLKLFFGADR
jgi:PadR family transcriptional regulator AphA